MGGGREGRKRRVSAQDPAAKTRLLLILRPLLKEIINLIGVYKVKRQGKNEYNIYLPRSFYSLFFFSEHI